MQRTFRPIAGFGPWGWALLPVALALAYCALGGYDLRLAIFQWWYDRFGWDGLMHLIFQWIYPAHEALWAPVCNPITLLPVLAAMHISPRRWSRWAWFIVTIWMLANPVLWLMLYQYLERNAPTGAPYPGSFTNAVLIQLAMFIAPLWWATRSFKLAAAVLVIGVVAAVADWKAVQSQSWPEPVLYAIPIAWQSATAAVLIGWAVMERRRARRETGLCGECGYDLRGLAAQAGAAGPVCPECGGKATAVGGHAP